MSKYRLRILSPILCSAITLALALFACQAPTISSLPPGAGLRLSVVVQPLGAAALTSRALGDQARLLLPGAASLTVTLTHLSGTMADPLPQTVSIAGAATSVPVSFAKLPFATWSIRAEARDAGGNLIASQTRQFEFSAASSSATVSLVPVPSDTSVASLPSNESIAGKSSKTWRIPAGAKLFTGPTAYILTTNPLVSVFVQKADGSLVTSMAAGKNLISAPAGEYNLDQDLYITAYNGGPGAADIGMGSDPKMVVMTDHGGTGTGDWVSIAASRDGSHLAACDGSPTGVVWTSADYGASWRKCDMGAVRSATATNALVAIAASADGSRLAVTAKQNTILFSKDFGATWTVITQDDSAMQFLDISSDATGTVLMATDKNGGLKVLRQNPDYTWADSGWIMQSTMACASIVCDGSGKLAVVGGNLYSKPLCYFDPVMKDWYNATCLPSWSTTKSFNALASSDTGGILAATEVYDINTVALSKDGGITWHSVFQDSAMKFTDISCNGDGSNLVVVSSTGDFAILHGEGLWNARSLSTANSRLLHAATMTGDASLINAAVGLDTNNKAGALWTIAQIP